MRSIVTRERMEGPPDVYGMPPPGNRRPVSLRARPIERTATLPDGRAIAVRVGVPEDSYIPRRELDTVDVELFDGHEHLAAVNTVLDVDQESEALALAREIVAGLESGELEPTAHALEPLADRLR
jgi:hypothetical protein